MANGRATQKAKSKSRQREFNAIGDYFGKNGRRSFWARRTDLEKFQAARSPVPGREWFPDTIDFAKMEKAGRVADAKAIRVATTSDLLAALGKIGATEPGSISRLNIFTHGSDEGEIILEGSVVQDNVVWNATDFQQGGFGDDLFENASENRITFRQAGSKREFSMTDVHKAFSKDAIVALYACHSGVDEQYLRKMSALFGVPVKGFRQELMFKLDKNKAGKVTSTYGLRGMAGREVTNFHDLDPFLISVP